MFSTRLMKHYFSLVPDRSSRFFTLSFKLYPPSSTSSSTFLSLSPQYQALIQQTQNKSSLLFAGSNPTNLQFYHIFQSPNELEAYEFFKKTPFYKEKMIESHRIQELEMKTRVKDKELAPKHLRDQ